MKTRTLELWRDEEYAGVLVETPDGAPTPDMLEPALNEEVERVIQETGPVEFIGGYRTGNPPEVRTYYHDERWLKEVFSNLKKKGYIVKITWREDGRPR